MHTSVWVLMLWVGVALQVIVVGLAVRLYRVRRSMPFVLLLAASICYFIANSAWFTFNFAAGFLHASPASIHNMRLYASVISRCFNFLFPVLVIFALLAFLRERTLPLPDTSNPYEGCQASE